MASIRPPPNTIKKLIRRFRPLPYSGFYIHESSEEFRTSVADVFESVFQDYIHQGKEGHFAKCCGSFERREHKNNLGHPPEQTIKVSFIIKLNRIETVEDLIVYLKKNLIRNEEGLLLRPTVNMRHPVRQVIIEPIKYEKPEPEQTFVYHKPVVENVEEADPTPELKLFNYPYEAPLMSNEQYCQLLYEKTQWDDYTDSLYTELRKKESALKGMSYLIGRLKGENSTLKQVLNQANFENAVLKSRIAILELNTTPLNIQNDESLGKRCDCSLPKKIKQADLVSQRISDLTRKENPMKLMTNPLTKKKR